MSAKSVEEIRINRAPVLALWGTVVAERLGFDHDEALSLGKAVTALNAQAKGRRLGIFHPRDEKAVKEARKAPPEELVHVDFMGRVIPMRSTPEGLRAVLKGRVVDPESAARYIESKFGEALPAARRAMEELAKAYPPRKLADVAFELYEKFRPEVPPGIRGWGAQGILSLKKIRELARKAG